MDVYLWETLKLYSKFIGLVAKNFSGFKFSYFSYISFISSLKGMQNDVGAVFNKVFKKAKNWSIYIFTAMLKLPRINKIQLNKETPKTASKDQYYIYYIKQLVSFYS